MSEEKYWGHGTVLVHNEDAGVVRSLIGYAKLVTTVGEPSTFMEGDIVAVLTASSEFEAAQVDWILRRPSAVSRHYTVMPERGDVMVGSPNHDAATAKYVSDVVDLKPSPGPHPRPPLMQCKPFGIPREPTPTPSPPSPAVVEEMADLLEMVEVSKRTGFDLPHSFPDRVRDILALCGRRKHRSAT